MSATVQELDTLLKDSAATEEFKKAVRDLQSGRTSPLIQHNRMVPPVKALRAITKLLEEEISEEIQNVKVEGRSGCSDFEGTLSVNDGEREYRFLWDCAWRAEQEGFRDHWGSPDQIRAARSFGYQCFARFERTK